MAYKNGLLPASALAPIPARNWNHPGTGYLIPEAAAAFTRLAAAFEARFRKVLLVNSAYRPLADQISIFQKNYRPVSRARRPNTSDRTFDGSTWAKVQGANVSSPGFSNHGGVKPQTGALTAAVDLGSGCEVIGSPEQVWMRTVGRTYGWNWDEGQANGEGWHFRWDTSLDQHRGQAASHGTASADATITRPTGATEEDELMAAKDEILAAIAAVRADVGTVHTDDIAAEQRVRADLNTVHLAVLDAPRALLGTQIDRAGGQPGKTTLGAVLAWSDAHIVATLEAVKAAGAAAGLTDAQLAQITEAVAKVQAQDVADHLTVQAKG